MKTNTSLTIIISAVLLLEMMMGVMFYAAQNFIQQTMERMAIALTGGVLWFDVNKGIERLSKILMPLLFVMLIVMAIHMVFLDGGTKGLRFLLEADFTKLTSKGILEAVGLSFFTLSIGMGALITYGSYMPKDGQRESLHAQEENVVTTSVQMIGLVIFVSLLAGMIVFPAVFAYGFSPTEGPELTFVTLPEVFNQMFSPALTSVVFFALMCVAAITSTISGYNLFDSANTIVTDILIPIGALGAALFTGWFVPKTRYQGSRVSSFLYLVVLRWLVPIAICIIFLDSVNII